MKDETNLDHRKKKIDGEKSAISFSAVRNYALDFRKHFLSFFDKCADGSGKVLNWARLNTDDRKTHLKKVFRHLIAFKGIRRDIKLEFAGAAKKGALGSATAGKVKLYDQLLDSSDYNIAAEVLAHEVGHVFQMNDAQTTLSRETVETSAANYVQPAEDYEYYRKNPMEAEAFEIGKVVGEDFTAALRRRALDSRAA